MMTLSAQANTELKKIRLSVALDILKAVAETIRTAGRVPAGTIYASLMTQGCTIQQYEQIERTLLGSGIIRKENNELIWQA